MQEAQRLLCTILNNIRHYLEIKIEPVDLQVHCVSRASPVYCYRRHKISVGNKQWQLQLNYSRWGYERT
uniref:Uncharacterized protein n=1 Tax=Anguilla anguilla TaxID=7936 RepID=A0A0E9VUK6_ANGAN